MKNSIVSILLLMLCCVGLSGCEVIGDIFGAGVYTGIFLVVLVVVVIIFIVTRIGKKN